MMSSPLLSVRQLYISSPPIPLVRGIDLEIFPGECFGLVGESGSGKSLTARAIMRLLPPSLTVEGNINFNGHCLSTCSENEMKRIRGKQIGMIFQDPMTALNPTMTVGKQLMEGLLLHESITYKEAQIRCLELLSRMEIEEAAARFNSYPFELSGGQRQRILIAMAVACKPKLLIADEPTTALDATVQVRILELLRSLQREYGMSLLFITHDFSLVEILCNRAAVMQHGEIVEVADVSRLLHSPQHSYTRTLLDAYSTP